MWPRAVILDCHVIGDMSYCTIIFPLFFITRTIRCSITNIPSTYLQNSWKLIFPCCFVLSLKGLLGTLVQSPDWVSKYGTKTKHFGDPVSGQIHGFICHSASWLLKQELGCRIFLINGEKNESVSQISRVISIKKKICNNKTGCCFQVLFIFHHIWDDPKLIFLRGIEHQPVEIQWQEFAMTEPKGAVCGCLLMSTQCVFFVY